jgi:DNA-binding GntR family transcriptional regulator
MSQTDASWQGRSAIDNPAARGPDEPLQKLGDLARRFSYGHRTAGEMVYEILREAIITGTLAAGERLRQETLADAIGVSRVPVRSALMQLESDGLVLHDHRGALVRPFTRKQVREIYDLRVVLECYALSRSIQNMTPARIERLRRLAADLDAAVAPSTFMDTADEFFRLLYDAEGNPELLELINALRLKVASYLLQWRLGVHRRHSHLAVVEAVGTGDLVRAQELLTQHIRSVGDGVVSMMAGAGPHA